MAVDVGDENENVVIISQQQVERYNKFCFQMGSGYVVEFYSISVLSKSEKSHHKV